VLTDKQWDYPHETPVFFSKKRGHFPGTLETPTTTELGKNAIKKQGHGPTRLPSGLGKTHGVLSPLHCS